jgi:hypothetical protein
MWKRPALPFAFMLFLGTPVLALYANDHGNKFAEIPQPSPVATSPYVVDGLALGGQVKSGRQAYQRYQCSSSDQFRGFISCNEEHTTRGNEVSRSHSILQSQDGTVYYVNRMSSEFGQQARIIQMPQREGLPNAVIALW